jgi:plastocyanin
MRSLSALIGTVAIAAAVVACGDATTTSNSASSSNRAPGASSPASNGGPAASDTLIARDFAFVPSNLTVKARQPFTLEMLNSGQVKHNVTGDGDGVKLDQDLDVGADQKVTFTAAGPGTISFHCKYHPTKMTGTITVTG